MRSREPLQVGAELYGSSDVGADLEIVDLMLASLEGVGVGGLTLDIGHVGIFRALARLAQAEADTARELFDCLQAKDAPRMRELTVALNPNLRSAFLALIDCHGDARVLDIAMAVAPVSTRKSMRAPLIVRPRPGTRGSRSMPTPTRPNV